MSQGEVGLSADLIAEYIKAPKPHKITSIRTPLGRLMFTRDKGESTLMGSDQFITNVKAVHRDGDGKIINQYDLGSGLVTNVGVLAFAIDGLSPAQGGWPVTNAPMQTLLNARRHASGTGATAAAATDIALQTPSGFGGQTLVTDAAPTLVASGAGVPKYQTIATISYTGTETVTEWGLFGSMGAVGGTALSSTTGSPFTAGTATTGTVTATPLTASSTTVQGQSQTVFHNTGNATPSWGLVTSNTTSVVTVPAWYLVSTGATGATPANTNAYVIRPVMLDHKVFTGIGVNAGDSIQFTYTLQVNSGG